MALTLDAMAERYGKLPTELLANASTVDLIVFDVALSYKNYQQKRQANDGALPTDAYSQEQLQQAMDRVRNK